MATRVEFYVLEGTDDRARLVRACRLVESAYLERHTVCVAVETPAQAEAMDGLLWTFGDQSFVPHAIAAAGDVAAVSPGTPVQIACGEPIAADLLVNLRQDLPPAFERYARIAEFVDADPARREAGRNRFKQYRDSGLPPVTHRV